MAEQVNLNDYTDAVIRLAISDAYTNFVTLPIALQQSKERHAVLKLFEDSPTEFDCDEFSAGELYHAFTYQATKLLVRMLESEADTTLSVIKELHDEMLGLAQDTKSRMAEFKCMQMRDSAAQKKKKGLIK